MSLQHLVSSSLWCSYFLSTLIGSREVTCFWRSLCTARCPPGGLSIARMVVSQESFLRHFPAKQGNPWRKDDILETLADFGIKALLGWALIDFSSVSSFSIIWKKGRSGDLYLWVPKLETTMKMNEVLHIIQVRCDHFILHPKLASKFQRLLWRRSTPPKARSLASNFLDARPRAARRKLLWRISLATLAWGGLKLWNFVDDIWYFFAKKQRTFIFGTRWPRFGHCSALQGASTRRIERETSGLGLMSNLFL